MQELELTREDGFTLVELMIVVVIIGILAAIAIPQMTIFQLRSKAGEAGAIIGSIVDAQKGLQEQMGGYGEWTTEPGHNAAGGKAQWTTCGQPPPAGHCQVGFSPSGRTYHNYTVGAQSGDPAAAFATPAQVAAGGDYDVGSDSAGYPCQDWQSGCVGGGASVRDYPTDDIVISATGNLDNDAVTCIYVATDERTEGKPDTANGVCGQEMF